MVRERNTQQQLHPDIEAKSMLGPTPQAQVSKQELRAQPRCAKSGKQSHFRYYPPRVPPPLHKSCSVYPQCTGPSCAHLLRCESSFPTVH